MKKIQWSSNLKLFTLSASAAKALTTALIWFASGFESGSSFCEIIFEFFPILFNLKIHIYLRFFYFVCLLFSSYRSAATVSIVFLIRGYWSKTQLKWSTLKENKLQYVSARTLATRRAFVNRQISPKYEPSDNDVATYKNIRADVK